MSTNAAQAVSEIRKFQRAHDIKSKGALSVVLFITRRAVETGLPLDKAALRTARQGQVAGLGRDPVQKILADYGIQKVLAEEGGRTSRGSLGLAEDYADFLNGLYEKGILGKVLGEVRRTLKQVEAWWIGRVKDYLNTQRIKLNISPDQGVMQVVSSALAEARRRQAEMLGATVEGTILHHLVGAKLALKLGDSAVTHHPSSAADAPTGRAGDFVLADTVIHVTVTPSEALMRKCRDNIQAGHQPIVVVPGGRVQAAEQLSETAGIRARLEIYSAEQFISGNLYERGKFRSADVRTQIKELVNKYNEIVSAVESDPSLQIEV